MALLSACFIGSCLGTYRLTHARLSEICTSSNVTINEGTRVTGSVGNSSCCPKHWKAFGSSCYFISVEEKTWPESEKNCSAMQAHLLVVTTEEEQNFIIQNLDTKSEYYIGLSDRDRPLHTNKRHWKWVDQTPYNESATFWLSGEPNSHNERCVLLHFHSLTKKWGWNDVFCDGHYKSICKMTKIYFSAEKSLSACA